MGATLFWTQGEEDLALEIDVATTETYEQTAEVTEHPVETGSAITDHVKPANGTITLEGFISNSPVAVPRTQTRGLVRATANVDLAVAGQAVRVALTRWSGVLDRVRECDALFGELIKSGRPVTLATSLRVTENLVLTRYSVSRTVEDGLGLPVTLDLKQLRVVTTSRAEVPALRALQRPAAHGQQPAAPEGTVGGNALQALGDSYPQLRERFPSLFSPVQSGAAP